MSHETDEAAADRAWADETRRRVESDGGGRNDAAFIAAKLPKSKEQ